MVDFAKVNKENAERKAREARERENAERENAVAGAEYLGDGAYVKFDGHGVWLTTDNGLRTTNKIYLEPAVISNLLAFVRRFYKID